MIHLSEAYQKIDLGYPSIGQKNISVFQIIRFASINLPIKHLSKIDLGYTAIGQKNISVIAVLIH
jgi:hypothetical protein